jgi:hypothetical protein
MTSSRRGKVRKISEEGKGECRKMPHLQRQAQWSSSALEARNQQSHSHVLPRIGCLPACLPVLCQHTSPVHSLASHAQPAQDGWPAACLATPLPGCPAVLAIPLPCPAARLT